MNDQLKVFLLNYSILSPHQSGFRAGHSTVSAVTLVANNIMSALDSKKHCAALFIDLSKAFETVDHDLLLLCLCSAGFDSRACDWFHSYLFGRLQWVKSGCTQSAFLLVLKGVPQGSVLGPVLFTIFYKHCLLFK